MIGFAQKFRQIVGDRLRRFPHIRRLQDEGDAAVGAAQADATVYVDADAAEDAAFHIRRNDERRKFIFRFNFPASRADEQHLPRRKARDEYVTCQSCYS